MNKNSLIEIGSKANLILRFKTDTTINGRLHKANEPYLYLKDVNVLINYSNQDKVGNTNKNIVAHSDIKPRTVSVSGLNFSRKLAALLSSYQGSGEYHPTVFRTLTAERYEGDTFGEIYLTEEIIENENLFVYDSEFNQIEVDEYSEDSNSLRSASFKDSEEYLISFSSVKSGTKFDMNKPAIPYMSLEIQGLGNIDKKTKNVLMYFDKVSLNSVLEFTFIQGDMINVPLEFHIIDDKKNFVVFED